ncbi:GerMN domain-containing protein [Aciduricibacillus chroicocephali]|uniref:GerMN domain-containing protein n=1 Tax=Aciduricibacillus chroicocephali TaxID=3054939 RepID=A0ABY9KVE2_9BACI|nr:GerMN domain-containing protein [Bacillaceae bacterium 44XB]
MQKRILMGLAAAGMSLMLTGCFNGEQSLTDLSKGTADQNTEVTKDLKKPEEKDMKEVPKADAKEDKKAEAAEETVARQLYLIDANGMVAPQTLELPKTDSKAVASQAMEYLVKGGPVSEMLPNGFQAVLPEGTQILGLNLKDGTMIVDVSKEFKEYDAKDEVKILEAMTHTLTQFENVERVQIWINGHPLDEMPVNGTPIEKGYSRAHGINVQASSEAGNADAQTVTMYFPKEHNSTRYYVPITKQIESGKDNLYSSIINELIEGPALESNAMHVFNTNTELASEPKMDEGVLDIEFTEGVLKSSGDPVIADEVMETLVRTLTQQDKVEAVRVKVKNVETLMNEKGEAYHDPVSKYKYMPAEKL